MNRELPRAKDPPAPASPADLPPGKTFAGDSVALDKSLNPTIDYRVDQETRKLIIRVVDPETGEIIRQIFGGDSLPFTTRSQQFNQHLLDEII